MNIRRRATKEERMDPNQALQVLVNAMQQQLQVAAAVQSIAGALQELANLKSMLTPPAAPPVPPESK